MILIDPPCTVLMVHFSCFMLTWETWSFLGKFAADQKNCLFFVDLFTLKSFVYSMKSTESIASKTEIFYREVAPRGKGQKTRLQTDQEFKQRKLYDLNKKYNVDMFSTTMRGGKALTKGTEKKNI